MNFNMNKKTNNMNFINNVKNNLSKDPINVNTPSIINYGQNHINFSMDKRLRSLSSTKKNIENTSTKKNIENTSNNKDNNRDSMDYSIKYIYIYTTKYTKNIAEAFKKYFISMDIETSIYIDKIEIEHIEMCKNNPNLYFFIICPQKFFTDKNFALPKNKYILYQTEQYNQSNIPKISDKLIEDCYTIYDYSNVNLKYYNENFISQIKILTPLIETSFLSQNITFHKDIDILFVGTINDRRNKILEKLEQWCKNNNYNIKIVSNIFGAELIEIINNSKLIINLHYYDNAILEVFRLHDILPYSCKIISENPGDEEEMDLVEKYGKVISFFPVIDDDLNNIDNIFKIIDDKLVAEIDFDERKKFIEEVNERNISSLKLNLKIKSYNFITFSTMGEPYDKGLNLIDKSKTIKNTIYSNNNYINYYNYNTENIIKNYGIETKNKYISEHYDISYRCIHHYRGNTIGFWKWKPFIIFEELKKISYNDILIYYDCNIDKNPHYIDEIKNIKVFTNKILNDKNFGFLYEDLNNKNLICKNYVKKDIFEKLGCTEEYFKNAPLKRANKLFIRKTKSTENLIYNWLKLTETSLFLPESNEEIMNSAHNNELYGWNTHDQAVLNILYLYYQKYNLL